MTNYQINTREWWVQRWLELLDSYRFKKRLERARLYAREGNVLSIDFVGAEVIAKVQGSEPDPYQVFLSIDPFTEENWQDVITTMSEKAIFMAELLAGEMPPNIEEVFTANGLSLFPFTLGDVHSRCSCPDKANPCKHIGAVYYQLGDRFSEDPFVIFQLRGRTKTEIIEALRQQRSKGVEKLTPEQITTEKTSSLESQSQEDIASIDIEKFWEYNEALESSLVVIAPHPESKSVLDILGNLTLAYDDTQAVISYLKQTYPSVAQQAIINALNRE